MSENSYNQARFNPETRFGVKAGSNISRIAFNPAIDQKINFGFVGGLSFKHISERSLGIQLELNYMQSGWAERLDSVNSYSRRLNYIQIPFMTHVNAGHGNTRFVFNFGPYISILLSEKESIYLLSEEDERFYYQTSIDNWAEYGLCMGLGISQQTTIGLFQLEGRVAFGLSNIFRPSRDAYFEASHNQLLEVTLSYFVDYKNIKNSISSIFSKNR